MYVQGLLDNTKPRPPMPLGQDYYGPTVVLGDEWLLNSEYPLQARLKSNPCNARRLDACRALAETVGIDQVWESVSL